MNEKTFLKMITSRVFCEFETNNIKFFNKFDLKIDIDYAAE